MRPAAFIPGAALAASALLAPSPSQAQRAAGLSQRDIPPAEQARDTLNRYAVCLVDARRRSVERALAIADLRERQAELARIAAPKCLDGGWIRMSEPLFRGALYRALYLEKFGRDTPTRLDQADLEADSISDPLLKFGDCVAMRAQAATHAFVVETPMTDEEDAALSELGPVLGECIDPTQQIEFSRSSLQALLAEALYKRASAARESEAE